ncbi:MAG: ABC-F family ATP-binding cassette domain-containing protein [Anaerolineales bacterium]
MLKVTSLSKSYADRTILRDVSFLLSPGERVGLVGPNGSGKTTLLRILLGREPPDSGSVQFDAHVTVGYLSQGLDAPPGATVQSVLDTAPTQLAWGDRQSGSPAALRAVTLGDVSQAEADLARAAALLADAPSASHAAEHQQQYDMALTQLQSAIDRADPARIGSMLKHLGLAEVARDVPVSTLSGGQKTRLGLALVLLGNPQLLLLDEPTNHLDLEMLAWLENWLTQFRGAGAGRASASELLFRSLSPQRGAALIVSHDRAFLDATITRILQLDPHTHTVQNYAGNYADYLEAKQAEVKQQQQAYADWQTEVTRLREAARHLRGLTKMRKGGKADDGDKFAKGFFSDQTTQMAKKAKNVERRIEKLLNDDRAEKPRRTWQMKLAFEDAPASGRDVLMLEELAVGYGAPQANLSPAPLLRDINLRIRAGERVALIGPNGSGKTTLVRTIIGALPPLAGRARLGANVRVGYFAQEHDRLNPALNALTTLQQFSSQTETELRNFLHYFLFEGDGVFTPVVELSFGERARLALATLVAQGCNFLVLDEPINHLDIPSRERFEEALSNFDGTALVIAHDRYFIERFATQVWKVERGTVHAYAELSDALADVPPP